MSRLYNLPIELRLIYSGLKNRIINEVYHKPVAYVEVVDIDSSVTVLATCTNFNVVQSRDNILGSFSCTITKAQDWNPRSTDYEDLLNIDKRKRVNIYYGQNIKGTNTYVKIFTGITTKKPETYSFGRSDYITLSGSSLAYLLHRQGGTYITPTFTGGSKELLEYWLALSSINYSLSYTDSISMSARNIAYATSLTGFYAFKLILGPDKEVFFDNDGMFIYRDTPSFSADEVEFVYDESNTISLNRYANVPKIITEAEVTGDTDEHSSTKQASEAIRNQYGRNKLTRNNGLIDTTTKADNLANAILSNGLSYADVFDIEMTLNPYLTIGSFITVTDSALSNTALTQVRAFEINHSYRAGRTHTTRMQCYSDE